MGPHFNFWRYRMIFRAKVLSKIPTQEFTVVTLQPVLEGIVAGGKLVLDLKGALFEEFHIGQIYEFGQPMDFVKDGQPEDFPSSGQKIPDDQVPEKLEGILGEADKPTMAPPVPEVSQPEAAPSPMPETAESSSPDPEKQP
jgi:hypothetical protein